MSWKSAQTIKGLSVRGDGLSWIYHNPYEKLKPEPKPEKVRCKCGCKHTKREAGSGPHKFKTVCKKCGKFLKWG